MISKAIVTENLILRKAKDTDLEKIWNNVWRDEKISESMLWEITTNLEEAKMRLKKTIDYQSKNFAYFICLKTNDEPIGFAGIIEKEPGLFEDTGLCIAQKFQGNGYAKEVVEAFKELIFDKLNGNTFVYTCFSTNEKSKRVCVSQGFKYLDTKSIIRDWDKKILGVDYYYFDKEMYQNKINNKEIRMKKLVFATGNPAKAGRFSNGLLKKGIEVLSLKDLKIDLDVNENGKDAIENALIKARECFKQTNMPSMGMDDTLYLENVPLDKQPGLFVRRVNGKVLNDKEMIEHYTNLVKMYGVNGKLNCKWIYGLAVIDNKGNESTYTWCKDNFYMVDVASKKINEGYPLNSISKYKKIDKYFTDVTNEELELIKGNEDDVIEFISIHI